LFPYIFVSCPSKKPRQAKPLTLLRAFLKPTLPIVKELFVKNINYKQLSFAALVSCDSAVVEKSTPAPPFKGSNPAATGIWPLYVRNLLMFRIG
jgi:hypothetical protein